MKEPHGPARSTDHNRRRLLLPRELQRHREAGDKPFPCPTNVGITDTSTSTITTSSSGSGSGSRASTTTSSRKYFNLFLYMNTADCMYDLYYNRFLSPPLVCSSRTSFRSELLLRSCSYLCSITRFCFGQHRRTTLGQYKQCKDGQT